MYYILDNKNRILVRANGDESSFLMFTKRHQAFCWATRSNIELNSMRYLVLKLCTKPQE